MTTLTTLAVPSPGDLPSLEILKRQFLLAMRMRNCSPRTLVCWNAVLGRFIGWSAERGIECASQVTAQLLAAYRRWLFHYRNPKTHAPLRFSTQLSYLTPVRRWFIWMADEKLIDENVAHGFQLPKEERRLPAAVLTAGEVESLLNATDVTRPLGLRDRALLETLYSTALRCSELAALAVYDLEPDHTRRLPTFQNVWSRRIH